MNLKKKCPFILSMHPLFVVNNPVRGAIYIYIYLWKKT
jgi:hypothetical protein